MTMFVEALAVVPSCETQQDGQRIASVVRDAFRRGEQVALSFADVDRVTVPFVHGLCGSLLGTYALASIREHLTIVEATRQVDAMIYRRFDAELSGFGFWRLSREQAA